MYPIQNNNNLIPQLGTMLNQALQSGALDPQTLMMLMQFLQTRTRGQAPNPMQRNALNQARGQFGPLFHQFIQSLMNGNVGQFMQQFAQQGGQIPGGQIPGGLPNNCGCGAPPPPACATQKPICAPAQQQEPPKTVNGYPLKHGKYKQEGDCWKGEDGSVVRKLGPNQFEKTSPDGKKAIFKTPKDKVASPLSFDLNGDGKVNTKADGTQFDITGKGAKTTGWVDKGDGVLAFDKNGDGKVGGDGTELFGNNTDLGDGQQYANGFQALAGMEKKAAADKELAGKIKADGVITADEIKVLEDSKYKLRMKTDANDPEGKRLSELGISQIDTNNYQEAGENADQFGNQHRQVAKQGFVQNGEAKRVDDVWFKYS